MSYASHTIYLYLHHVTGMGLKHAKRSGISLPLLLLMYWLMRYTCIRHAVYVCTREVSLSLRAWYLRCWVVCLSARTCRPRASGRHRSDDFPMAQFGWEPSPTCQFKCQKQDPNVSATWQKRNHNMSEPRMRNVTWHLSLCRIKIEMHQDVRRWVYSRFENIELGALQQPDTLVLMITDWPIKHALIGGSVLHICHMSPLLLVMVVIRIPEEGAADGLHGCIG